MVTLVLLLVLYNQRLQTERLLHSFNVIFDEFKAKLRTYPPKLQTLLQVTIDQVDRQGKSLRRTFRILQWLAWLPAVLACAMVLIKYNEPLQQLARQLFVLTLLPVELNPLFLSP
ncbi:hypothetical protein D9M71_811980 [compost metagenome]